MMALQPYTRSLCGCSCTGIITKVQLAAVVIHIKCFVWPVHLVTSSFCYMASGIVTVLVAMLLLCH